MGDEERSRGLPQRAPGAARPGPGSSTTPTAPALSEELQQRMRAAVDAEHAQAKRQDTKQATDPTRRVTAQVAAASHQLATAGPTEANRSVRPEVTDPKEPREPREPREPKGSAGPRGPGGPRGPRRRRLVPVALILILIVAGSLGTVLFRYMTRPDSSGGSVPSALQRQELAARTQAVTWVIQQVDHHDIVACDRLMCAELQEHGFPAGNLRVLGPKSPPPVTSSVVVTTEAIRYLFGTSIETALAPPVLASFGRGDAGITIRVVAPDGVAAYQAAATADLNARKTIEASLLNDNRIMISTAAAQQLMAGLVDSRLALAIASLATAQPIDIVQFGNIGQGASAGIPLRFADLAVSDPAAHLASPAYVRAMRASLNSAYIPSDPPSTEIVVLPGGHTVFRVEFPAPSPFGLLSSQGS
jgi:hypothetical protein